MTPSLIRLASRGSPLDFCCFFAWSSSDSVTISCSTRSASRRALPKSRILHAHSGRSAESDETFEAPDRRRTDAFHARQVLQASEGAVCVALLEDRARSHRADSRKLREQSLVGAVHVDRIQIDDNRGGRGVRG